LPDSVLKRKTLSSGKSLWTLALDLNSLQEIQREGMITRESMTAKIKNDIALF
jgi:hypothetical protein